MEIYSSKNDSYENTDIMRRQTMSERIPCAKCKLLGEKLQTSYRARKCNLHGIEVMENSIGCSWANNPDSKCKGLTSIIIPAEEVFVLKRDLNHYIMYRIGQYAGKWFAAGIICNTNYGSCSYPSIFSTPFESRKRAVDDVLRRLLATARSSGDDEYVSIIEKTIMDNRQLTLF